MGHSRSSALIMALSATCLPTIAFAQSGTDPQADSSNQLDEITVTARKTSENLQQVPIAITALGSDTLAKANAQTVRDIATLTPGLTISGDGSGRGNQPSIRGLSFTGDSSSEGNVAVMLDGAYISNPASMNLGMMDFERVEVVKGPQSAAYGRNAFAGAINYVSKAPPSEFGGKAEIRTGTHETNSGKLSVGGPLIPGLLNVRAGAMYDFAGGSYTDAVNGKDIGGWDKYAAELVARVTPSDRLTFDLGFYYGHDKYGRAMQASFEANCGAVNPLTGRAAAFCGEVPSGQDLNLVASNFEPSTAVGNEVKVKHARGKATYDLDVAKIELSGSFFDVKQESYNELFGVRNGLPFILAATETQPAQTVNLTGFSGGAFNNKDYSADFRVSGGGEGPIQWAFGAYYFMTDKDVLTTLGFNSSPIPAGRRIAIGAAQGAPLQSAALINLVNLWLTPDGNASDLIGVVRSKNSQVSGFGSVAVEPIDGLTANAELRYTSELKRSNVLSLATAAPGTDPDGPDGQRARFKYWNPRFTVNYQVTDSHFLYASLAKGTKSGGFNQAAVSADELSYAPENNWTYEVGLKNTLFNRRVHLNIAAFYVDWSSLQILVPSAVATIGSVITNYGSVKARGGELELQAKIVQGVTLSGGLAYTDPKFGGDTYDFAAPNIAVCRLIPTCASRIVTDAPSVRGPVTAISLNKLVRNQVSRWQLTGGLNIDRPLAGDWNWFTALNYKYESSQFSQIDDIRYVGPRHTMSLQAGVERDNIRITAWAMNLLNDLTPYAATAGQGITRYNGEGSIPKAQVPDKRRVGVTLGYTF